MTSRAYWSDGSRFTERNIRQVLGTIAVWSMIALGCFAPLIAMALS